MSCRPRRIVKMRNLVAQVAGSSRRFALVALVSVPAGRRRAAARDVRHHQAELELFEHLRLSVEADPWTSA